MRMRQDSPDPLHGNVAFLQDHRSVIRQQETVGTTHQTLYLSTPASSAFFIVAPSWRTAWQERLFCGLVCEGKSRGRADWARRCGGTK
jgi:hypothetical protein